MGLRDHCQCCMAVALVLVSGLRMLSDWGCLAHCGGSVEAGAERMQDPQMRRTPHRSGREAGASDLDQQPDKVRQAKSPPQKALTGSPQV